MSKQSSPEKRESICVGIPCFQGVSYEVLSDYMRFAYHLGRRYQDYDFFLAIKGKSEQFRARNAIVESALASGCDYMLMLDDDHVIDIENTLGPNDSYNFLRKLIDHLKEDQKKGIVGALYYQRGAACDPVIMQKNGEAYSFYKQSEISGRLQKVDVTGGGCMVIDMKVFDKIPSPWFEPELGIGTDVQICKKVTEAGWEVWCDTSINIGHLCTDRKVITGKNAHDTRVEAAEWMNRDDIRQAPPLKNSSFIRSYRDDVLEFTGKSVNQLEDMAEAYGRLAMPNFNLENLEDYYRNLGMKQLARNFYFHSSKFMIDQGNSILRMFNSGVTAKGLDFGCGSAPIGFELALRGHEVSFIDIPGSYAESFVKWRAEKHGVKANFEMGSDYDWAIMLDSIEHLHPLKLEETLVDIISRLKIGASIVTNYWTNMDFTNTEHISMDHMAVEKIFLENGLIMVPVTGKQGMIVNRRWMKGEFKRRIPNPVQSNQGCKRKSTGEGINLEPAPC